MYQVYSRGSVSIGCADSIRHFCGFPRPLRAHCLRENLRFIPFPNFFVLYKHIIRDSPRKSDCILSFPTVPARIRALAESTLRCFLRMLQNEPAINLELDHPASSAYPVTFSTSHRTRGFESRPLSRGRHRSRRVSPSSMRIPQRLARSPSRPSESFARTARCNVVGPFFLAISASRGLAILACRLNKP